MPIDKLVFLDECGFALNLHSRYGWCVGGGHLEERVPFNKGVNLSVVGAYSLPREKNPTGLWALWQRKGAWTAVLFELFLQDAVLPELPGCPNCPVARIARLPEGSVLVLDNARIHNGPLLKEIIEEAGHSLLYLPAYSPDFNPIELVWSWLKTRVRDLAPRSEEQRLKCIRLAQSLLPSQAAHKWFLKAGLC